MASNKCDMEEHLVRLISQYFVKLLVSNLEVSPANVVSGQVFVKLETVIESKINIANEIK